MHLRSSLVVVAFCAAALSGQVDGARPAYVEQHTLEGTLYTAKVYIYPSGKRSRNHGNRCGNSEEQQLLPALRPGLCNHTKLFHQIRNTDANAGSAPEGAR